MTYLPGQTLSNEEIIVRRIPPIWLEQDDINYEAFRPMENESSPTGFEDGISCEIKSMLVKPVSADRWARKKPPSGPCGAIELPCQVPNELEYPVISTPSASSPAHCIISGDMAKLNADQLAMELIADSAEWMWKP